MILILSFELGLDSGQGVFKVRDLVTVVRLKVRDLEMYYVCESPHKDRTARRVWGFLCGACRFLWIPSRYSLVSPHYPKTCIRQRGELWALN